MKYFFIDKLLGLFGRKMDGKKTYAGAAGKILTGIATLATGLVGLLGHAFPDQGLPEMAVEPAWAACAAGVALISDGIQGIGLGHKAEKLRREVAGG